MYNSWYNQTMADIAPALGHHSTFRPRNIGFEGQKESDHNYLNIELE